MASLRSSDRTLLDKKWTRVSVSRTVDASPEAVWGVVSDATTWLDWYRPLSKFEVLDGERLCAGAKVLDHESLWKSTAEVVDWQPGSRLGLSTSTLNLRGLLRRHYREISIAPVGTDRSEVTITGGFQFGLLGWLLVAYTYPQMLGALWFEYRSALKGLKARW